MSETTASSRLSYTRMTRSSAATSSTRRAGCDGATNARSLPAVSRRSLCLHEGAQRGGVDERAFREDDDEIVAVQLLELSVEYGDGREVELADDVEHSRAVGAVRAKNESG